MNFFTILQAFRDMAGGMDARPVTNLLAIGDSVFEINAAKDMATLFPTSLVKTVKLDEKPSPFDLVNQLDLIYTNLYKIATYGDNMEVTLARESRQKH